MSGPSTGSPDSRSHTRTVSVAGDDDRPTEPHADRHRAHPVVVAGERAEHRLARLQVPHPHRPVVAAGDDDGPTVPLADRHRAHPGLVAGERAEHRLARLQVPHPHRTVVAAGDDDRPAVPLADRHRAHPAVVAAGDVVRVGSLAADPASCPGLVQAQLVELVGEVGTVTSGGELQVAGPLARRVGTGGQVGVGMPVDLGVAGGRLAGALQRGEQPGRVSRDEKPRIVEETGELADVGGVSGQLAVQVGVGGLPVTGAVGADVSRCRASTGRRSARC